MDQSKENINESVTSFILKNDLAEIPRMLEWLEGIAERSEWGTKILFQLNLVIEEILVNIISYGYSDDLTHEIEMKLRQENNYIELQIIDDGQEFDPTKKEDPDTSLPVEERNIGGLGIFLTKETMDLFTYERIDSKNIVTIGKNLI